VIDMTKRVFALDVDDDNGIGEFIKPLPDVICEHMRTSPKLFRPSTLQADFRDQCKVVLSRQAIHSALLSLLKKKLIVKAGRGEYHHAFYK